MAGRSWHNNTPEDGSAIFDDGTLSPTGVWSPKGGTTTGGVANITTSINPRSIYTPQQTAVARNQAVADAHKRGNLNYAMKQFDRPGISRGAQSIYRAMPKVANAYSDAAMASAAIPLADEAANQQNMLRGQIAQGLEFNQLARLLLGQQQLSNWTQNQNLGGIGGLLGAIGSLI